MTTNSAGTDLHFSLDTVFEIAHPKPTLHHEEQLIFIIVMMPDKLTLQFHDFYVRVVDFAHDLRRVVFRELRELFAEIHFPDHPITSITASLVLEQPELTPDAESKKLL